MQESRNVITRFEYLKWITLKKQKVLRPFNDCYSQSPITDMQ